MGQSSSAGGYWAGLNSIGTVVTPDSAERHDLQDFSERLRAATTVGAYDTRAREAQARYVMRPQLAQERLHPLPNNLVRIELKRAFRDGTVAIDLDPLSLLCRLAAAVPPPEFHLVHYSGVLGAASKFRPLVIPPPLEGPPLAREQRRFGSRPLHPERGQALFDRYVSRIGMAPAYPSRPMRMLKAAAPTLKRLTVPERFSIAVWLLARN